MLDKTKLEDLKDLLISSDIGDPDQIVDAVGILTKVIDFYIEKNFGDEEEELNENY